MSAHEVKAARRAAPVVSTRYQSGEQTVFRIASSTGSQAFPVPDYFRGNWVRVSAYNCDAQIAYSTGAAPTLVFNQTVPLFSTGNGSTSSGMTHFSGLPEEYVMESRGTVNQSASLAPIIRQSICSGSVICSAANGFIEFELMEGMG